MKKLPIVSLFCGAGGLDYGFDQEGFRTALAVDYDDSAVASYNLNAKEAVAIKADLASTTPKELLALLEERAPGVAPVGLIGGPPCQGFSRGNVQSVVRDPRNTLPFRYAEILRALNEKFTLHFFVFENVTGLLNSKHAPRYARILRTLRAAGFHVSAERLHAHEFGVPQRRPRLFIVGLNKKLYSKSDFTFPEGKADHVYVQDVLRGLPEPTFYAHGIKGGDPAVHPNHWTMKPKSKKFRTGTTRDDGRSFKRLVWDKISPTVAYGNREIHVHPTGTRRLSILEAMLLQGFPPSYRLAGSLSSQVTQVSNAVPPPVAQALAASLRQLLRSRSRLVKVSEEG